MVLLKNYYLKANRQSFKQIVKILIVTKGLMMWANANVNECTKVAITERPKIRLNHDFFFLFFSLIPFVSILYDIDQIKFESCPSYEQQKNA